eukprot:Colp12_sorted_trinity150504_noHs@34183
MGEMQKAMSESGPKTTSTSLLGAGKFAGGHTSVKRRLDFGEDMDNTDTSKFLQSCTKRLNEETKAKSARWNFDFENDRPFDDAPEQQYEWSSSKESEVPAVYTTVSASTKRVPEKPSVFKELHNVRKDAKADENGEGKDENREE